MRIVGEMCVLIGLWEGESHGTDPKKVMLDGAIGFLLGDFAVNHLRSVLPLLVFEC